MRTSIHETVPNFLHADEGHKLCTARGRHQISSMVMLLLSMFPIQGEERPVSVSPIA